MKVLKNTRFRSIRKNQAASSPAVSIVIITAATVVLVLVAGTYANQVLERQQAASEFDTVQNSILAFDDAVRDIAWDNGASRSIRFTTKYGDVRPISGNKTFEITTSEFSGFPTITTSVVKYSILSNYLTIGTGYSSYILGDESPVVSSLTDSLGQALVKQEKGFATIGFNYRVRVYREGPSVVVDSKSINYVNIMVIRLNCNNSSVGYDDFELVAKNVGLSTTSYGPFPVGEGTVSVVSDGVQESVQLDLDAEQVMFNLIIADVQVSI